MWTSFVNFFLNLLLFIYKIVGNFGVAIIIFTVLIKLLLFPLTKAQTKSSKGLSGLASDPEYIAIEKKYKDDKERLLEERLKFYKEKDINPYSSCLTTLIQFPIIIALYQAIIVAIVSTPLDMLNLTKRIIPGWIQISEVFPINPNFLWMNLGMPERFYIGNYGFPVLAVLVVITTILQSKLTAQPKQGDNDSESFVGGMMNIYMPLLMGFLSYSLASGLALYFLISNVFSICQNAVLGKLHPENLKSDNNIQQTTKKSEYKQKNYSGKSSSKVAATKKSETKNSKNSKANSQKTKSSDDIYDKNIDYSEFKKHKKQKKTKIKN